MIRLPTKKKAADATPAPPVEEPLVEGALKAKTETPPSPPPAHWGNLPGPNAKRIACAFCGQVYYVPCKGDEHLGCMNFHAAERKRANAKVKEKTP